MMRSAWRLLNPALITLVSGMLLIGCSCFKEDCEPEEVEFVPCCEEPLDVCIKVEDKRWCKEGGYGMPKISIYLKKDLALLVKDPIIEAFEKNNLINTECGVEVQIELEQFFCDVVDHRSIWNCVSEIIYNARVVGRDGQEYYSRRIDGLAETDFEKSERSGKSRKALEAALEDSLKTLLEDKSFSRAIKKASQS